MDLSLTQLKKKTAKACIKALVGARSIQSLHLTSPEVAKIKKAANKILKFCLFDEALGSTCPDEIS